MKSSTRRYTRADHHVSKTCLAVGSIFFSTAVALSLPFGFDSILPALGVSLASVALAWTSWNRHSNLAIPLIAY